MKDITDIVCLDNIIENFISVCYEDIYFKDVCFKVQDIFDAPRVIMVHNAFTNLW